MGILQARILEWVAMPSSRGSSCIAGGFFTVWATREAQSCLYIVSYLIQTISSPNSHQFLKERLWVVQVNKLHLSRMPSDRRKSLFCCNRMSILSNTMIWILFKTKGFSLFLKSFIYNLLFKNESKVEVVVQQCPNLCDPMDYIACQAPLSPEFSRQEFWSGLPFPPPRDLPDPRIEPGSPALQADSLASEPPRKPLFKKYFMKF